MREKQNLPVQLKATYAEIWKIAYPIMIGSLAQTILGITDTAFMARVGEAELGASAIGGVFYFVMVMAGLGFGIGAQIIMARKAGENNNPAIGSVFDHSLLLLVVLSFFLFFAGQLAWEMLFPFIIQSPLVAAATVAFLKYRMAGIFFMLITIAFRSFYTGIAQTRIITYSAIVMTVLNILLGYAMVFGHFGFRPMGIEGAGLASAVSEGAAAIYLLVYTRLKRDLSPYGLFRFKQMNKAGFGQIIRLSLPVVLQNLISIGAWFAFFVFIERLGTHELAISNIIRSTYMILMTPVWGFSSAANSMVSNFIGQKKPELVMSLLKKTSVLSFSVSFLLVAGNLLFARDILRLTASDEQLVGDSLLAFYVICFATLIFSVSMILFSGVSGTGATRAAMFLEMVNISIYLLYVYVCAVWLYASVEVVWMSEVLYWFLMGLFSIIYLRSRKWLSIQV